MPVLSLVIITWNQADKLRDCLDSVFRQKTRYAFEVIVVVNGCTDHTLDVLKAFPVHIIVNISNLGVAPARNQGIGVSRGRLVMMLDDDTLMQDGCIEEIVAGMDSHPDAWGAGTKTYTPSRALEYSARTFYTFPVILLRRTPFGKLFPHASVLRHHLMSDWDHMSDRVVDWVSGAGFVMKREAINAIGPFDERFFFGLEDVDWCYRVGMAGKKIYYLARASIVHYVQGSSRKLFSPRAWHHFMGLIYFQTKHGKSPRPGFRKTRQAR